MVVNTEALKDNPEFAKALVGIWYETLATMKAGTARRGHGGCSGTDLAGFDEQLATTKLFDKPADAVTFTTSGDLKTTRACPNFFFDKALLGKDAKSAGRRRHRLPGQDRARRHEQREVAL